MLKKIISLLLAAAMLPALSCCGGPGSAPEPSAAPASAMPEEDSPAPEEKPAGARLYEMHCLEPEGLPEGVRRLCPAGEGWLISVFTPEEGDRFYLAPGDFSRAEELNISLPEDITPCAAAYGQEGEIYISGFDGQELFHILRYEGPALKEDILLEELSSFYINQLFPLPQGFLLISGREALLLSKEGEQLLTLMDGGQGHMAAFTLPEGGFLIVSDVAEGPGRPEAGTEVRIFGPDLKETARFSSPFRFEAFAMERPGRLLALQSGTVFSYDYEKGLREPLIDAMGSSMNLSGLYPLGGGRYAAPLRGRLTVWSPAAEESFSLSLAAWGLSRALADMINMYNASGQGPRIQVTDYAVYDGEGGPQAGYDRLCSDIIAGFTPDLYDLSSLPAELFAAKGVFEDLKPYLSRGPVLLSELTEGIPELLEKDGHIYYMMPSFYPRCIVGPGSISPEGWDSDKLFELAEGREPVSVFGPDMSREALISSLLLLGGSSYVDKESLSCSFADTDFVRFLEFSAALPGEDSPLRTDSMAPSRLIRGEQLLELCPNVLSHLNFHGYYNTCFGGDMSYLGFPHCDGSSVSLCPEYLVAVSSASEHKEESVDFIRYILSQDRAGLELPARRRSLEAYLEKQIVKDKELGEDCVPKLAGLYGGASDSIVSSLSPEESRERLMALISSADILELPDMALLNIVLEQCRLFWAGGTDAHQAARAIESRVSIYLSEQYG